MFKKILKFNRITTAATGGTAPQGSTDQGSAEALQHQPDDDPAMSQITRLRSCSEPTIHMSCISGDAAQTILLRAQESIRFPSSHEQGHLEIIPALESLKTSGAPRSGTSGVSSRGGQSQSRTVSVPPSDKPKTHRVKPQGDGGGAELTKPREQATVFSSDDPKIRAAAEKKRETLLEQKEDSKRGKVVRRALPGMVPGAANTELKSKLKQLGINKESQSPRQLGPTRSDDGDKDKPPARWPASTAGKKGMARERELPLALVSRESPAAAKGEGEGAEEEWLSPMVQPLTQRRPKGSPSEEPAAHSDINRFFY